MQPPKNSTVYWLTTQLIWFTLLRIILLWIIPSYTDICFNNASLVLSNESNSYVLKHEACINSQRHVRMCFGKSKTFTILQRIFSSNVQSDKMLLSMLRNKVRCCYYHWRLSFYAYFGKTNDIHISEYSSSKHHSNVYTKIRTNGNSNNWLSFR